MEKHEKKLLNQVNKKDECSICGVKLGQDEKELCLEGVCIECLNK